MFGFKKKNSQDTAVTEYSLLDDSMPLALRETYNSMRTNLMFIMNHADRKQIVFTSAVPSEGKTTTSINAAILFAQTGAKVLVIDADMRRPKIHRTLKLNHIPGLSDTLARLKPLSDCIQASSVENLDVLAAGTVPPNPSELLLGEQFDLLLKEVNEKYDYVIIDAPPIKSVTDATIISTKVLGAVIVVRSDFSQKPDVLEAVESIESVGGKVLGFVLNAVNEMTGGTYRGYRYGYAGKYAYQQYTLQDSTEVESTNDQ